MSEQESLSTPDGDSKDVIDEALGGPDSDLAPMPKEEPSVEFDELLDEGRLEIKSVEDGVEKARGILEDLLKNNNPETRSEEIQILLEKSKIEKDPGLMQLIERAGRSLAFGAALNGLLNEMNKRHKGRALGFIGENDAAKLERYLPTPNLGSNDDLEKNSSDGRKIADLGEILEQIGKLASA
ncbi:MAG: hypothetical protein AAB340_01790 [Patescibacteria group bacterium]